MSIIAIIILYDCRCSGQSMNKWDIQERKLLKRKSIKWRFSDDTIVCLGVLENQLRTIRFNKKFY